MDRRHVCCLVLVGLLYMPGAVITSATAATAAGESATRTAYVTMSPTVFEGRVLTRINVRRHHRGCRPLRLDAALVLAARRHSDRMSQVSELSHRLAGEPDLAGRVEAAGYTRWRMLAENLAWGQASPRAVFRAWVRSPGHRANLDNCRLRDVGLGVVIRNGRPWVTADFGRRYR